MLPFRSSKLTALVTKLHEYLDHSPEEEPAASEVNEISSGKRSPRHAVQEHQGVSQTPYSLGRSAGVSGVRCGLFYISEYTAGGLVRMLRRWKYSYLHVTGACPPGETASPTTPELTDKQNSASPVFHCRKKKLYLSLGGR